MDGDITISNEEKAYRVKSLIEAISFLYRDIKGRRENLSPLFVIGGRYERKNPFFENRISVNGNKLSTEILTEIISSNEDIKNNTVAGVLSGVFDNDSEIKQKLNVGTVIDVFAHLKKEVDIYYGESN